MNTRTIARDCAEDAPDSLGERIARFAMAINACSEQYISKAYWKQAQGELAGEPDTDPKESGLESAPESERWHPVPGSIERYLPVVRQGFRAG